MVLRLLALALALSGTAYAAAPATPTAPAAAAPVIGVPPADDAPQLRGRIVSDRYFAASGAFSVALPKLNKDSAAIMDSESIVVFKDQVSMFVMIGGWAMPAIQKWQLETSSPKEFLVGFFRDYVLRPSAEECPEIKLEEPAAGFLPEFEGGALLTYTLLPNSSAFKVDPAVAALPNPPTPVAKRGTLVFLKGNHVFAISIELAERVTQQSRYNLTKEKEDKVLLERLSKVASAMEFFPSQKPGAGAKP